MVKFSVVVPTYNRVESLERCLGAIAAQDLPREAFEVVVVDDGSEQPPRETVARFAGSMQVRLIEQANAGPAAARNAGALAARGHFLAFTDDDCRPSTGWLSALNVALRAHPRSAVGGSVVSSLQNSFSIASQLLVDFLYHYFDRNDNDGQFFVTANVAMPADMFKDLGGFDLTFPFAAAEDRDLCERWREHGFGLVYSEDAVVWHSHPLRLGSFCRQHFTYGRGAWFLNKAKSRRGRDPLRVPPVSFYSKLVAFPLSKAPLHRGVILASLAALSQLVYTAGFFWQSLMPSGSGTQRR